MHHINGNNSDNRDENIAVLCVKDHDFHHRPNAYDLKHTDLSPKLIKQRKDSWEAFVEEAKKEHPKATVTLGLFGTEENIVGAQAAYQWLDGTVEFVRKYQLLDAHPEKWIDSIIEEVQWLGKLPISLVDNPLPIEYCEHDGSAYFRTIDEEYLTSSIDPEWKKEIIASIYINPTQPSFAFTVLYKDEIYYQAIFHKCNKRLIREDYKGEWEIILRKRPSIRSQVAEIVSDLLESWNIPLERLLIGTGDPDNPNLIRDFNLPKVWEKC